MDENAIQKLEWQVRQGILMWMRELLDVASLLGLDRTLELDRCEWLRLRSCIPDLLWLKAERSWFERRMSVLQATDCDPRTQFFDDDGRPLRREQVARAIEKAVARAVLSD